MDLKRNDPTPELDEETKEEIAPRCSYRKVAGDPDSMCDETATWIVRWVCQCGPKLREFYYCTPHMGRMVAYEAICIKAGHPAMPVGDPEKI